MYLPRVNQENDISVLHDLICAKPFGAWTTLKDGQIEINHLPFVLEKNRGEYGTLVGHIARANQIWKGFSTELDSAVIFQGEHGYISPNWYPSKAQHGKAVPTWNYITVHAYGVPQLFEQPDRLFAHLNTLTNIHEGSQSTPWSVSDAPANYIDKMLKALIGIEIPITKLQGKWKLGQNRSDADKAGTIQGLLATNDAQSHALAEKSGNQ